MVIFVANTLELSQAGLGIARPDREHIVGTSCNWNRQTLIKVDYLNQFGAAISAAFAAAIDDDDDDDDEAASATSMVPSGGQCLRGRLRVPLTGFERLEEILCGRYAPPLAAPNKQAPSCRHCVRRSASGRRFAGKPLWAF